MRRIIEEENQKRRKALRRHYNETVRELASFMRKRDKRVLAHNVRWNVPMIEGLCTSAGCTHTPSRDNSLAEPSGWRGAGAVYVAG